MAEREPTIQTIDVTQTGQEWSQLLDRVGRREARVVVEKGGVPVAAIISAKDLERLHHLEAQRAERFKVLHDMRAAFKDVPPEEIEREVARARAEVREESRRRTQQP